MSGSDTSMYNQAYKNIDRPYANVDLSRVPSWELVMNIMEQQALEARRQMMIKYQVPEQMLPQTIANFDFRSSPYDFSSNNGNNSTEDSDNSFCSEDMSSRATATSQSDDSQCDSDIEIDVDSVEESDEYFMESNSFDNIPITVLQFESKLTKKEQKRSWTIPNNLDLSVQTKELP